MARTRMPPSGKIPVSTAALRTSSTISAMSTRASRLAEYSMVKCGMSGLPNFFQGASSEVTAHRSISTIVGLNRVAFAGLDRANQKTCRRAGRRNPARRCQARSPDLVALDDAASSELDLDPRLLDRIGIRKGDTGM